MRVHTLDAAGMPLHEEFLIAGTLCAVATNHQAVIDSLAAWKQPCPAPPQRSFELNVLVDSASMEPPKTPPYFRGLHHLVFATFRDGELFLFDLRRGSASGVVSRRTAEDVAFWRHLLIPVALGLLGATMGLVPVHSACLDRNGRGLMIAGASGAGKSTLAVALAKSGFALVSDDWTYVASEHGRLRAYGVSAPVKLLPDAASLFPELNGLRPSSSLNGELSFEVEADRVFGSGVRPHSDPKWIVFLERTEESGCEIAALSSTRARTFFESNLERLPEQFLHATARRSELIGRLAARECLTLRYGGPPWVAAEALIDLCNRSWCDTRTDRAASHTGA